VEFGDPEKILQSKIARSCYLGEEFCM